MRNSKVYSILKEFDRIEQNRFRKYLTSPYFNRDQALVQLYDLLINDVNGGNGIELEKEVIWKQLNLGSSYNDTRFRKYCSDLLKLAEGFLAQEVFEERPMQKSINLINAVGKKKLDKLFNSTMRTAQRISEKQPFKSASFFYDQYEIEKNYYEMAQHELKRAKKSNLEKISNKLDIFYLSEKLRLHCEVLSRRRYSSFDYSLHLMDEILDGIEKYDLQSIPAIAVYYQIHLMLTDPETIEHYFKLKKLLAKHGFIFPKNESISLYHSAINYCIQKLNKGNQSFLDELFDLYNDLVEKEKIFNGELSPWTFRNLIVVALRLGKYDWSVEFINQNSQDIHETYRENAVTFNLATVYFYQKKYLQVLELLQEVEYDDPSYNLNSKAMLLATYYELEEIEPLYSLFESFRVYLNRKKDLPEDRKSLYKNLIKYTKKLTKLMPGDAKSLEKLKQEVNSTKNIASIGWLKEKIGEMEG